MGLLNYVNICIYIYIEYSNAFNDINIYIAYIFDILYVLDVIICTYVFIIYMYRHICTHSFLMHMFENGLGTTFEFRACILWQAMRWMRWTQRLSLHSGLDSLRMAKRFAFSSLWKSLRA